MIEKCSVCGNKLEDEVKFCPDCGEKVPPAQETKKVETKTKSKAKTKKKKTTTKFSLPKLSLKNAPKPVIAGIALLCIAIIAVAGVVVISPFDTTGSIVKVGGRVFSVDIENTCDADATCYLTVGGLRYNHFGANGEFKVPSGDSITITLVEEVLFRQDTSYDITLFATIGYTEKGTAFDITESAEFSICQTDGELVIESTGVR
jgi:uncharacterized OB-fold protein